MPAPLVVFITGVDRREMVREALLKLGNSFVEQAKAAKQILIHPNLVTSHRQTACTHLEAVRGILDHLSLHRADEILIGDAGYHNTKKAFEAFDYPSLQRSGNIRLIDLNDDATIETYAYTTDFKKRPIGFAKTVAEADFNIVVVPAKMHSYYTVSLSLKTHIVGSMVVKPSPFGIYARWPWLHTGYKQAHLTLAEIYLQHPAQLAIIDGTQAMEGDGPASGDEINLGWLIAAFDPVAADTLASYLMGFDPETEIGYLYFLKERGVEATNLDQLEIIGNKSLKTTDLATWRRQLRRPSTWPEIGKWQ
ncbi:MAG: DUF362 domain-containing protein [Candidatus Bathyarchaeia archaeon]